MPRKKAENKTPNTTTKKATKTIKKTKKKTPKVNTQNKDIENVIRYMKSEHTTEDYNKYLSPLIKSKGKQYVDKLIGSTMIVFEERGFSLDDIAFDENDNLTVVKRLKE